MTIFQKICITPYYISNTDSLMSLGQKDLFFEIPHLVILPIDKQNKKRTILVSRYLKTNFVRFYIQIFNFSQNH